ncbi:MAG TPA: IS21-like element helper ATPase IstB [Chloroflexota bacterium]|nr:IS21-like element helper ATPase IstB [Chloroflexota bacterium]
MTTSSRLHAEPQAAIIDTYLKQLKLPAIAREYHTLARDAERQNAGYLCYLQALLEREVAQREERHLQRRLRLARFPYEKRLEDFDFSVVPSVRKEQVLALAQGAFIAARENMLLLGPSGVGKTHLLLGVGRATCLRGYRVLFCTAATLASELELAQRNLRLPKFLAQLRRFDLVLVDEVGYLPFSHTAAELLFQFFADRYERASVGVTSNLDFAQWTEVFGHERMTAALLDRLVHRATILLLEGESYRFRQSLQQQIQGPTSVRRVAPTRQPEAGDQGRAMEAGEEGRTGDRNAERNVDGQVSVTLELQDARVEQ